MISVPSSTRRNLLTTALPGALLGSALGLLAYHGRGGSRRTAASEDQATPRPATPVAATPVPVAGEARALWVNRFEYASESDVVQIMERAAEANFNIVYFQARGAADALYRSEIEPCAVGLCGQLGGTPPYDPLEVAVREARDRGIQVHAWLNALSGWPTGNAEVCDLLEESPEGDPQHILLEHPEWAMVDRTGEVMACPNNEEYIYLSPGYDGVRAQLANVAADIARRYEVAGIHLDRIRYPGQIWSYDEASLEAFGQDPATNAGAWAQFRRDLVNRTVRETYDALAAVDPSLVLSAAVWAVYEDRWDWGSSEGYSQYFQDPRAWAADGYLDVAVPMTYFPITENRCDRADWACLLDDHLDGIQAATGRHLYISTIANLGADEVERQIELSRQRGANGFAIYSYRLADEAGLWSALAEGAFAEPAPVPDLPWKESAPPADAATPEL